MNTNCHLATRLRLNIGFPFGFVLFCFWTDHKKIEEILSGLKVNSVREKGKYFFNYGRCFFTYNQINENWYQRLKTKYICFLSKQHLSNNILATTEQIQMFTITKLAWTSIEFCPKLTVLLKKPAWKFMLQPTSSHEKI